MTFGKQPSNKKAAQVIEEWPRRLPLNNIDKMMIALSFVLLVVPLVRLAMSYGTLPAEIPSHYNAAGAVDGYDGKWSLLVLGGVDVLVWLSVAVCNFFPQAINVPVFLLKRSAEEIISGTRVLLNVTNILCVGLFWYLIEGTMAIAMGNMAAISGWVVFGFVLVILLSSVLYFVWLWRA